MNPTRPHRLARWSIATVLGALIAASACTFEPDPGPGPTTTSSTTTTTAPPAVGSITRLAAGGASSAVISRNGRWVAFSSTNSSPGVDGNAGAPDVFLHDRQTSVTTRITGGNRGSFDPSVSDDGAVTFRSAATDLIGTDTNDRLDVFYWSSSGGTVRVTDATDGDVGAPLISSDGSTVAFAIPESMVNSSGSSRAVAALWRPSAPTTLTPLTAYGAEGASPVAVSEDGGLVLLAEPGRLSLSENPTLAATLVAPAPASPSSPRVTTFSVAPHALSSEGDAVFAEVTYRFDEDTNVITFESSSLKRWDRQTATTSTISAAGIPAGPAVSEDGSRIVTADYAGTVIDQDAGAAFLPGAIRVIDGNTTQTVLGSTDGSFGTVSADGRYVAFVSTASSLALPDPNGAEADVYLWDRGS